MAKQFVFPIAEDVGFNVSGAYVTRARVYEALRKNGKMTLDEIRAVAWPDAKERDEKTIHVLLKRMQKHLVARGITITKGMVGDNTYRLGRV